MTYKKTYNPCDECNYSYSKNNQESGMCKICEFKELVEKSEREQTRWIPVSERLPENYKTVLVQWQMKNRFNNTIEIFLHTGFINEYGEWIHADGLGVFNGEIIAWMPLPEPYKAGETE